MRGFKEDMAEKNARLRQIFMKASGAKSKFTQDQYDEAHILVKSLDESLRIICYARSGDNLHEPSKSVDTMCNRLLGMTPGETPQRADDGFTDWHVCTLLLKPQSKDKLNFSKPLLNPPC